MRRLLLSLPFFLFLLPACDQQCVGPNCEEPPDEPWTPADDDDDASGDDDDATPPDEPDPEIVSTRSCDATLRYRPPFAVNSVDVAGEFNGWTPAPMDGPDDDGYFTATLEGLAAGNYGYKYLHNGDWEGEPPASAWAVWIDGNENRKLPHGDCSVPLLQTVSASGDADSVSAEIQFASASDGALIDPATLVVTVGDTAVTADVNADEGTISIDVDGLPAGKHSIRVTAADTDGRRAENEPLFIPLWVEAEPFDWEDGLMYFVFTDRFRNGDGSNAVEPHIDGVEDRANFQGGDFLGVIQALEEGYFEALGVNVLWLTPVYENPNAPYLATDGVHQFTGFHGYWPVDPLAIESRSGDAGGSGEDRLQELIDKAHERGIRVMFDLVLNHVHQDHTWTQQHPEWFTGGCVCGTDGCGWDERTLDCWFTDYLPDLNYRNRWIVEEQLEATLRLVETYDADAVRVDAAKHMDHVIMRGLRKALRTEFERNGGAEFYAVGETFTGGDGHGEIMNYVNPHELDGQFDFPLFWSIREAFAHGGSFQALEQKVATGESAYGNGVMSAFLGNHDIPRFATEAAGNDQGPWAWSEDLMAGGGDQVTQWDLINKLSMGFLFTLTQPGVPLLYYGDEVGLAGGGDPDNRRMMTFDPFLSANQRELLGRVQAIGQARKNSKALRRGDRRQLWVDDNLLVYALVDGSDVVLVAMNKGGEQRTLALPVGDVLDDGVTLTDRLNPDRTGTVDGGTVSLVLNSWEYAILAP